MISGLSANKTYFFSVANVKDGVESLFCNEYSVLAVGLNLQQGQGRGIRLLPNTPNPFSETTRFIVEADAGVQMDKTSIVVSDVMGRQIQTIPVRIFPGSNVFEYKNALGLRGIYIYSLCDNGHSLCSGKMVIY
jgi:hypothetical protein